jgi:2-aminobenzoate-CoA ligase
MRDTYVRPAGIPAACLVPPELQPDYTEVPGCELPATANVAAALLDERVARGNGGQVAAVHAESGRSFTFTELAEESTRLARALVTLGLEPGDRIAFRSPNRPEMLLAVCAAWKAGGVVVPTPLQARPDELRYFLDDAGAKALLLVGGDQDPGAVRDGVAGTAVGHVLSVPAGPGEAALRTTGSAPVDSPWPRLGEGPLPASAELPETSADSVAVLWHTGGTTGRPKGCYHTHRRFLLGGHAVRDALEVGPGQRWAAAAPVGHALGLMYHTVFTLLHGATAVFIEEFRDPAAVVRAIDRHGVNTFTAIMASWAAMLGVDGLSDHDLSSLNRGYAMWQTASAAGVRARWEAHGLDLMNNYGSTAFGTWPVLPRRGEPFPPASLGRPAAGYEVTAVERDGDRLTPVTGGMGQLAVRGPTGLTYWNRPELQRRDVVDGWTLADDLIEFDPTGNISYLGRTDFLISTAGYKVAPVEVEAVLATHDAVQEVAVVGSPDPIRQEVVMAFVVPGPAAQAGEALAADLRDWARAKLSPYKCPRRVEFVDRLPRDAVGKVQTGVLKEWAMSRNEESGR